MSAANERLFLFDPPPNQDHEIILPIQIILESLLSEAGIKTKLLTEFKVIAWDLNYQELKPFS